MVRSSMLGSTGYKSGWIQELIIIIYLFIKLLPNNVLGARLSFFQSRMALCLREECFTKNMLRMLPHNPEELPGVTYKIFENHSIDNWVMLGLHDVITTLLKKEVTVFNCNNEETRGELHFHDDLTKCLDILNEILPEQVPVFDDIDVKVSRKNQTYNVSIESLDKLISTILPTMISLMQKIIEARVMFERCSNLVAWILLKSLYWSSEDTLTVHFSRISGDFLEVMEPYVNPFCEELSHVFISAAIIIFSKFPRDVSTELITPNIILKLRPNFYNNLSNSCPLVSKLKVIFQIHNLEKRLWLEMPSWKSICDVCEKFKNRETNKALMDLKILLDEDVLCVQQMMQSEIIYHLEMLMTSRINDVDIKTFLSIMMELDDQNSHCPSTFRYLILLFRDLLDYCSGILQTFILKNIGMDNHKFYKMSDFLIKDIQQILNIMQALYILNGSWYQLFDLVDVDSIFDDQEIDNIFMCQNFSSMLTYCNAKNLQPTFMKMIETCPAACSLETKIKIIKYVFNNDEIKIHQVRRDNVLKDVKELYETNPHQITSLWELRFKEEIGAGHGPTKEVYSILSQDLQSYDLKLWQRGGKHSDDDNETYMSAPVRLFPNNSADSPNDMKMFEFIGKLLAKAVLDEFYLDIPLSEEFFRQLLPSIPRYYNHLKKDYYDIPRAFPFTEITIKNLISMKRQKDKIMSKSGMSDSMKKDIIKELTFDDGSSLEDLFLNFTVPGSSTELIENGKDVMLTHFNLESYLEQLCFQKDLLRPSKQFEDIRNGFNKILVGMLNLFTPLDLKILVIGDRLESWTMDELRSNCQLIQGYDNDSEPVEYLFEVLISLDENQISKFLKFTTGTPTLPFGGLSWLRPPLTISKTNTKDPYGSLPCSSTCFNILFLPEYNSVENTREKLLYAIEEGNNVYLIV